MSNDRYENVRRALAMGPTPGPRKWWEHEDFGYCCVNPRDGGLLIAKCDVRNPFDPEQRANAALIAACDPDTIRALLAERDALRELLREALDSLTCGDTGDDLEDSHRCGRCDEYVDRNAKLRMKIRVALSKSGEV